MYSNHGDRSQTIETSACGPTAFSIVVSTLNNIDVPPTEMCNYALTKGFRTYNSGTSADLFSFASSDSSNSKYNLNYQNAGNLANAKRLLADNKHLVIASMGYGHVTRQGHYIVLAGYKVINGKGYFEVYDPHRWNEYYIYDGEIIDTVKDDGYILLSEKAIANEAQGYYAFSSKGNRTIGSGEGNSVEKDNSTGGIVNYATEFVLGIKDAGFSNVEGIYNFITDPFGTIKDVANGIGFLGNAAIPGTEENEIGLQILKSLKDDLVKGNPRLVGRIVGEIIITILITKGAGAIKNLASDSGKLGKLSAVTGKLKNGKMTATQAMDEIFGGVCFTGDTLILTDKGLVEIKEIKEGDRVYSKNLETNEIEIKPVVRKFKKETKEIIKIRINGEEIKTTREHPFYVENKGFVKAEEIKKDDILVSEKGKEKVEGTEKEEIQGEKGKEVYNFEVEGNHNYFVGKENVLVHNTCVEDITKGVGNRNSFNFGNEKKFDKHFDKHVIKQGGFGNITKDDYLKLANEFIDSSGKNVLSRTASNGDILKFNNKTNEFSIVTKDGVIRTYHKLNPQIHGKGTNLDYWNSPDCNY